MSKALGKVLGTSSFGVAQMAQEKVEVARIDKFDPEMIKRNLESAKYTLPEGVTEDAARAAFWEYGMLQGTENSVAWRRAIDLVLIAPTYRDVEKLADAYGRLYTVGKIPVMPDIPEENTFSGWRGAVTTARRLGAIPADGLPPIDATAQGNIRSFNLPTHLLECPLYRAVQADRWMRVLAGVLTEPNADSIAWLYRQLGSLKGKDLKYANNKLLNRLAGDPEKLSDDERKEALKVIERLLTEDGFNALALPPSGEEASKQRATSYSEADRIRKEYEETVKARDNLQAEIEAQRLAGEEVGPEVEQRVHEMNDTLKTMAEEHADLQKRYLDAQGKKDEFPALVEKRAGGERTGFTALEFEDATAKRFNRFWASINAEFKAVGQRARSHTETLEILLDSMAQARGERPDKWSNAYAAYLTMRERLATKEALDQVARNERSGTAANA